ncbi:MAG: transglutaminase family protein [Methanobacteriota archaeon]
MSFDEGIEKGQIPRKASLIFTFLTFGIILGMVILYYNSTVAYWQDVSFQRQQEISALVKELSTAKEELTKVHANLSLRQEELSIKEKELEAVKRELVTKKLLALPPGMDEHYSEIRREYFDKFRYSYWDVISFYAMMVLHDTGQIPIGSWREMPSPSRKGDIENGGKFKTKFGIEASKLSAEKLREIIREIPGYEDLTGREKIPRYREAVRERNAEAFNNYVTNNITYLEESDYPRFPLETLAYGMGDCEDKAMLLAALLETGGYEAGLLLIYDAENKFFHQALAVRDENEWARVKFKFKGYEAMGRTWIILDPTWKTEFGELPEWTNYYKIPGGIEIPPYKYVFLPVDADKLKYR